LGSKTDKLAKRGKDKPYSGKTSPLPILIQFICGEEEEFKYVRKD